MQGYRTYRRVEANEELRRTRGTQVGPVQGGENMDFSQFFISYRTFRDIGYHPIILENSPHDGGQRTPGSGTGYVFDIITNYVENKAKKLRLELEINQYQIVNYYESKALGDNGEPLVYRMPSGTFFTFSGPDAQKVSQLISERKSNINSETFRLFKDLLMSDPCTDQCAIDEQGGFSGVFSEYQNSLIKLAQRGAILPGAEFKRNSTTIWFKIMDNRALLPNETPITDVEREQAAQYQTLLNKAIEKYPEIESQIHGLIKQYQSQGYTSPSQESP